MMDKVIIYIHGQGGNADEAKHYEALFENQKVIGIDYKSETTWEAAEEFPKLYDACKDDQNKALFFVHKTIENNWSRSVLLNFLENIRIQTMEGRKNVEIVRL